MKLLHRVGERADALAVVSVESAHEIARFRYADLDRFVTEGKLSVADLFATARRARRACADDWPCSPARRPVGTA